MHLKVEGSSPSSGDHFTYNSIFNFAWIVKSVLGESVFVETFLDVKLRSKERKRWPFALTTKSKTIW